MTSSRFIRHVTLTTGHVRDSHRTEISEQAIAVCADLIMRAIASVEPITMPGPWSEYSLGGQSGGRCVTLMMRHGADAIATIGIAAHSRCGAALWRAMHTYGSVPVVTDPERCPPEPWVAVALDEGLALHPDAAEWLGDLERCLAWAWLSLIDGIQT